LDRLQIVDLNIGHLHVLDRVDLADVVIGAFSFAALIDDIPVAAGGIVENMWPGRGYAWFISSGVPRWAWGGITRAVKKAVDIAIESGFWRVEMYVRADHNEGCMWAQRLGFSQEGLHPRLLADGSDGWIYGRTDKEAP
jgi:hypothetical protein